MVERLFRNAMNELLISTMISKSSAEKLHRSCAEISHMSISLHIDLQIYSPGCRLYSDESTFAITVLDRTF
jgi:hypothetical protein